MRAFLNDLRHQVNVKEWQVAQASEALRVFYQEFLGLAWARRWPDRVGIMGEDEAERGSESAHGLSQQGMLQREYFCIGGIRGRNPLMWRFRDFAAHIIHIVTA